MPLGTSYLLRTLKTSLSAVEKFTEVTGRFISWATVTMVILVVLVVITRYFLGLGSIALQESVTYLHCLVFMMGFAFTLKHDGHVRVDIFYRGFSPRFKAIVNLIGGLQLRQFTDIK